jgi:hypothetical protein
MKGNKNMYSQNWQILYSSNMGCWNTIFQKLLSIKSKYKITISYRYVSWIKYSSTKSNNKRNYLKYVLTYRCLCIIALKAKPSLQLVVKFLTLTLGYPAVFIWHHNKSASLADLVSLVSPASSTVMSWIYNQRKIAVKCSVPQN